MMTPMPAGPMTFNDRDPGDMRPTGGGSALASILAAMAPCAIMVILTGNPADARCKSSLEISSATTPLTFAAAIADEVSPGPCVTTPSAPVACFGICELSRLASLVQVRCVAEVIIARIGGLYGP